ncbi:FERM, ARHGEF and pleckstrin domain-containing protein 2-like [Chironomus tepperi]|uniref:FERM, ARHGEF and pleckstrin domain-containing protein 2-like n=1 Tax=Chironomus tepperi TaxID=113505 RepID=UPI00391EEC48
MSLNSLGTSNGGLPSSRMTHSLSTPSGVDGSASTNHTRGGGKKLAVRVQMLDDSMTLFQVQAKALGKVLFEQVCRQLNLLEADYFGLEYTESSTGTKYWLDLEKTLNRQVGFSLIDPMLRFCVKFYANDPTQLEEEYTRFLFCLQIKRDLATGSLQCNDNTAALMASYIVQASCGDYSYEDYPDHTYLSSYRFVPQQDQTLQRKIMENHKKHIGQSPAEADLNLLETARRCELYGMKMHAAKDHEGVPLNLSVAHFGIAVFQGITRINTFSWAKIRKLSFKRKKFLIKLHPEGYGYYKDIVEFFFDGRNECKNFWKKCVENHGFFRCQAVQSIPRRKTRVLSRGSSFRYSGKTQKQIIEFVRENYVKRQTFQRSQSFRQSTLHASKRSQSQNAVNTSISAHPLLPIETAEWEARKNKDQKTPSQKMKMEVDTEIIHQQETPTPYNRAITTTVESYQMTKSEDHLRRPSQQADSSLSVSPAVTTPPRNIINNAQEVGRVHVLPDDRNNLANSDYHGINGSLDRRSEPPSSPMSPTNRYDLTIGSDKSMTYDVAEAERNNQNNLITSPLSIVSTQNHSIINTLERSDTLRKKLPSDKAYFISKEILMTERTYRRDLDVINLRYRKMIAPDDVENLQPLFDYFESMVQHHSIFLRDLEHRIVMWESRGDDVKIRIGDVMLKNMVVLPIYEEYVEFHREIIQRLNDLFTTDDRFQQIYKEFEQEKVCYLPLSTFLLKPLHRLLHYQKLLELLLEYYSDENDDKTDVQGSLVMLSRTNEIVREQIVETENFVLLCEIQRDLAGFDNLVQEDRKLIRQGCLLKHSRRGLQQRMFFLFTDVLIYASKPQFLQTFKVLGHVPVRSLLTENGEHNSFTIFAGGISWTLSAGTTHEKNLWMDELQKAAANLKNKSPQLTGFSGIKCCTSSEEGLEMCGLNSITPANVKTPVSRNNTSLHVCWHRGITVSLEDHIKSSDSQISGYLLRKFKNSSGWQKLWVVLTQFCLFFYKSYQDEIPLASLPLLGYYVGPPSAQDAVQKDFVFKLSFKNHTYFFRSESEISYQRWMDNLRVICINNQKLVR